MTTRPSPSMVSLIRAAGRKNALINGAFEVWQRGTSFSSVADGAYTADRWRYLKNGSMTHTVARSTDTPTVAEAGVRAPYSILVDCTAADSSIASTEYTILEQPIEGHYWGPFAQRGLTLSFWVKATKTGTYCVSLRNSGLDRSFVAEYTVTAANTWERKIIPIPASPSGGTWNYETGIGARLGFALAAGSSLQGAGGSWQSSNIVATSNQVNATDDAANDFRLALVQLELGSWASDFEMPPFAEEVRLCERYYQVLLANNGSYATGQAISGTASFCAVRYPVRMRAAPTVTLGPAGSSSGQMCFLTPDWAYPGTVGSHSAGGITAEGFQLGGSGYSSVWSAGSATLLYATGEVKVASLSAEL